MMAVGASINDGETMDDVTHSRTSYWVKQFAEYLERGVHAVNIGGPL